MEVRSINAGLVLRTIEKNDSISRADVGKIVGLTPPTISAIVKDLIERDIVQEIGKGASSGGKKPIMLKINSKAAYMIAVDLGGENGIRVALMDLSYHIIKEKYGPKIESLNDKKFKNALSVILTDFIREMNIPRGKILGICIGVPGIVDFKSKKIIAAPCLNWEISLEDLDLIEIGISITIENDVNLMALGEKTKGIAQKIKNFVFVGERTGIGAGIIINRKLYEGANNAAGEVGYLLIDPEYAPKSTRDHGCLEKLASYKVIVEKAREKMGKNIRVMDVYKAAAEGDNVALGIVKKALKFLAYGIANISCVLDPELVIIGGGISILPPRFLEEMKMNIRKIIPFVPKMEFSKLGEDGVLIGAAVMVLEPLKRKGLMDVK
ncbi:MAG: ROK family transcriptional regulator [Candidatus Atribacteria bacterium]|nr:ROK family transcriptional regulator [Candidatus Atribacteria bacterium]